MANEYINKVIYGGNVLIDLTGDTVTASDVLTGIRFHDRSGAIVTGACDFDADTSDATAGASEILATKTAYVAGSKVTGTMPNNGAVTGIISDKSIPYTIPQGYHDGSGTVGLDSASLTALIANNIRENVTILGIVGTMSGSEDMKPQAKTVTPSTIAQTIIPDTGYNCLSQVLVDAISYTEVDNMAGGKTVTIAGV